MKLCLRLALCKGIVLYSLKMAVWVGIFKQERLNAAFYGKCIFSHNVYFIRPDIDLAAKVS